MFLLLPLMMAVAMMLRLQSEVFESLKRCRVDYCSTSGVLLTGSHAKPEDNRGRDLCPVINKNGCMTAEQRGRRLPVGVAPANSKRLFYSPPV